MAGWETLLSATGPLDADAVRRLQAIAVTTVDDLRFAIASTPAPIARLIGVDDLSSLERLWDDDDTDRTLLFLAAIEGPPALGAEPPDDVEVLEEASEEMFAASLDALGPTPEELPVGQGELRRVDCIDCLRPIRSQGERGTCVAHAVAAVFECLLRRQEGVAIDLSPQFLYWSAKQHDGRPEESGTLIRVAIERVAAEGVCEESDWLYDPVPRIGDEGQGPPPAAAVTAASTQKASGVALVPKP